MKKLLSRKLQLDYQEFNESQYIQAACELTVMSKFVEDESVKFSYENEVTHPKNVDFSIIKDNVKYNVEVKCPSYKPKNISSNSEVTVTFTNRVPSLSDKNETLKDIQCRLEKHGTEVIEGKNLDNTLKDFLESTQAKVKGSTLQDVNILVVCCNDEIDMNIWRGYLFGFSGFFTEHSFVSHGEFNRVDYVLLTNIYNRHYKYYYGKLVSDHWSLLSSFNLLYPNKYSTRNQDVNGQHDLENMNKVFPNHNIKFEAYMKDNDTPKNESFDLKEQSMGIAWYTDRFKKTGPYYFSSINNPNKSMHLTQKASLRSAF